jgi:hypothetical protein
LRGWDAIRFEQRRRFAAEVWDPDGAASLPIVTTRAHRAKMILPHHTGIEFLIFAIAMQRCIWDFQRS